MKHKLSTASTLLYRASNLPSTNEASNLPSNNEGKTQEIIHVTDALKANGYPSTVISNTLNKKAPSQTVPPPEELVSMFFKWADPPDAYRGFACLPYIKGLTEPLTRLLSNTKSEWSANPLKLSNKNSRLQNLDSPWISKQT